MSYWFDPIYYLILAPPVAIGLWASVKIALAARRGGETEPEPTGAEIAAAVFQGAALTDVSIQIVRGDLADYYHAGSRALRLSPTVYEGRSLRSRGIAIHEAGHALQHAAGCRWLAIRNLLAPLAALGSGIFWITVCAGFGMGIIELFVLAIAVLWINLLLQILVLPIELDASRRGVASLVNSGRISPAEVRRLKPALEAAECRGVAQALVGAFVLNFGLARSIVQNRRIPANGSISTVRKATPGN